MEITQILGKISYKLSWTLWRYFKPYRTFLSLKTDIDTWALTYALSRWKQQKPKWSKQ